METRETCGIKPADQSRAQSDEESEEQMAPVLGLEKEEYKMQQRERRQNPDEHADGRLAFFDEAMG